MYTGFVTIDADSGEIILSTFGLPNKVLFSFNAKDCNLPKGITLEFDDTDQAVKDKMKGSKRRVEINYTAYTINTGLSNAIFK